MKETVLITGASRGIGKAIALTFASAGYDIVITCSNSYTQLKEVEQLILDKGCRCLALQSDISAYSSCELLFDRINDFTSNLSVVINNAATSYIGLITDMTNDQWQKTLNTNLSSLFHTAKFAVPLMVKAQKGTIINISSVWGNVGASCEVAYSASKGGVNAFTKALAKELAPSNIRVNAIACGVIDTEMNQWLDEDEKNDLIEGIGLKRLGSPMDIGNISLFLASKKASYITGQILTIDGGL